ncbi:class III lanthionine synthetase LanKC [Mycoavidus sp. SF9855]|uniref:class III lanthionine synthetase LanKC n=1 Tax=Mycoavidus sp. SF9855 TaxID=2968475 RepID=UPI00211C6A8C|nr:class III lanthionine synthetase LanKC [Mycoavidus sp. SF9855]UUM21891.1 class III lanthionine synthetase LanKC [Mycoavidus sp. SF9855]
MAAMQERRIAFEFIGSQFYETLNQYKADTSHYINLANQYIPKKWKSIHQGIWNHCYSPLHTLPTQGWKIHLSATPYNARTVLATAIPMLVEMDTAFKFAADRAIFSMMTGKNWARGSSGKFITIYPQDEDRFREMIERIYTATKGFVGPYILSDRRYKDSSIVHYRYGGMQKMSMLNERGELQSYICKPSGERIVDERRPSYQIPTWLEEPFPCKAQDEGEPGTLKKGRYLIKKVLAFRNSGGVYLALDRMHDREVVIKEARPYVGGPTAESDAISLLQKEYRILKTMEESGYTPAAYDLFQDWENWFLVEEYIDGEILRKIPSHESIVLRGQVDESDIRRFHQRFIAIFLSVSKAIMEFHERGIALNDLSPNNILVSKENTHITFIDFEAACQVDTDLLIKMKTPGYAPPEHAKQTEIEFTSDYYALAAMMLTFIFPANLFFRLESGRIPEIVREIFADAAFPEEIAAAVIAGLSPHAELRPAASEINAKLSSADWSCAVVGSRQALMPEPSYFDTTIDGIRSFIEANAILSRADRLFPCDFRAFDTNPLSLGCGAYGTLFGLHQAGIAIDPAFRDWAQRCPITNEGYTPGFLMGQAGIAWIMTELKEVEQASVLLTQARAHPLFDRSHSLFEGKAGWAFSALRLFLETQDEQFLDAALNVVDELLSQAKVDAEQRIYWPHADGKVHLGLGYGACGIALVLLYAALLTNREHYIEAGMRALHYDISYGHSTRGWSYMTDSSNTLLPYYMYGSAGIGTVLLRYQYFAGIDAFDQTLEDIYAHTDGKYSVGFGKLMGLCGIAGFRLDAWHYTKEERHRTALARLLSGMDMFRVQSEEGLAYPSLIDRISCDFGYGTAGILTLLARIRQWTPDELTLDRYFDKCKKGMVIDDTIAVYS